MFLDHIVYNAENVESLLDFYTKVVGFKSERAEQYHKGEVQFPSVRINEDTIIDIFPKEMWGKNTYIIKGRPNLNHFCLALSHNDWQKLSDRLIKAGVEIINGPITVWGAHGDGVSIYFNDPEGNTIEAKYYKQ